MNPIEIVESDKNCVSEMSLGFQVTVGKQLRGGHNLTPLVGIGLKGPPHVGMSNIAVPSIY